jgi:hypothetical protein
VIGSSVLAGILVTNGREQSICGCKTLQTMFLGVFKSMILLFIKVYFLFKNILK